MTEIKFEDFGTLLEESFAKKENLEGSVVKGTIIALDGDTATVDVGLKSEGRVSLKEFGAAASDLKVGDKVDVYIDRYEDKDGLAVLSREKARREESWKILEKALEKNEKVTGTIFGRVKGGFTVDLDGAIAFLPGSQIDARPIRDISALMGTPQPFLILKMDRIRGNIVVSRRAILEETRAEQRSEIMKTMEEGQIVEGVVKNITDYGAFIDLGGVDGLLHVTDISWKRINHPSETLSIGQTVKVQIIRFNKETQRISLGMKQLESDPWENAAEKFPVGKVCTGRVTNITEYGAFVELDEGIEGLVHVSEMSWVKKNTHPGKLVSTSQEVEVMVLDVDTQKRRISLGIKQTQANPWEAYKEAHTAGEEIEGEIRNITEFGLFIALTDELDGMIHMSDLSWETPAEEAIKEYKKGTVIKAKILDIDAEKERIALGVKQLTKDPFEGASKNVKKGDVVTTVVTNILDNGVEIDLNGMKGFIKKADLSRERAEQRPERFAVGEKVDAKVTQLDSKSRKVTLSIKAREIEEEKQALSEFGSTDSGASLGDILGAALAKKKSAKKAEKPAEKKATKAKKKEEVEE
ncbi:MAG: 30S ribosomal protein S1 [Alphaproteobacteria bacterium]|nr:30S ribosomal protein S1 [Alphaproteobacteria bacterium]